MSFGERLKELIDEKEVSQKDVAAHLNIAVSTLNGYANDYREPDFSTLVSLSKYFNVSTDFLLGLTNVPAFKLHQHDEQVLRLIYYYERLNPCFKKLLIEEAKLFSKFDNSEKSSFLTPAKREP